MAFDPDLLGERVSVRGVKFEVKVEREGKSAKPRTLTKPAAEALIPNKSYMADVMISAEFALLAEGSGSEAGRADIAAPSALKCEVARWTRDSRRRGAAVLIVALVKRAREKKS